jgi:NAD-dependent dihydropyrimidine dehydrogenase PreA subunit
MAKGRVSIVVEHCKACGLCVEFFPSHVLALASAFNSKGYHPPHVVHPEKCSGCDYMGAELRLSETQGVGLCTRVMDVPSADRTPAATGPAGGVPGTGAGEPLQAA